jgi:hypothetical protein
VDSVKVLFLQREGTDLYHTLLASETSRLVLRFYQPKRVPCGISVFVASLGSALSLAGELKWYRRRYMREVLFGVAPQVYCTHALAKEVYYERDATLTPSWECRKLYGFMEGKLLSELIMDPGVPLEEYTGQTSGMVDTVIEVWCMPEELEAGSGGCVSPDDEEPEPGSDDLPR